MNMAFSVNDLQDLLTLLREHPEWRAEVRKEVLGDELLVLPDVVRELVARLDALTEELRNLVAEVRAINGHVERLVEEMAEQRQEISGVRVEVGGVRQDVGGLKGMGLETWYQRHPGLLTFKRGLGKIRVPSAHELEHLETAFDEGRITHEHLQAVYNLDLVISGREGRGDEARDAMLAVEISVKIDQRDVIRALDRAGILRTVGYNAYPMVAGVSIDARAGRLAQDRGVDVYLGEPEHWSKVGDQAS